MHSRYVAAVVAEDERALDSGGRDRHNYGTRHSAEYSLISIDPRRSRRCHRFSRLMSAHTFLLNSISTGLSGRLGLVCVFRPQRDAAGARRVTRQEQLRADQKRSKHLGVMRKAVHAKILFGIHSQAQPTEQLAKGDR